MHITIDQTYWYIQDRKLSLVKGDAVSYKISDKEISFPGEHGLMDGISINARADNQGYMYYQYISDHTKICLLQHPNGLQSDYIGGTKKRYVLNQETIDAINKNELEGEKILVEQTI